MKNSIKKQLRANALFLTLFAICFSLYCLAASAIFQRAVIAQSDAIVNAERKRIVIDPGHGGEDCGAIGVSGILEKDINLSISEKLYEIMSFAGYEVIPTRREDILLYDRNESYEGRKKVLDLAARRKTAEDAEPDLFVGIHMNSFPQEKYSGLTVYYSKNDPRSYKAAQGLRGEVVSLLQPSNERPMKAAGSNIYLLDRLTCPAILIECGFLSNAEECAQLSDEAYRQKLSFVFYSSLSTFLEE